MKYDIKKLLRSRIVKNMILCLFIVAIIAPISTYIIYKDYGYFSEEGANPFQYWLLNYTIGWAGPMYFRMFFLLPVLSTGMIYFYESSSSIREILLTKISRKTYYTSKILSVFTLSFCTFLLFFSINLVCTHLCFHGEEMTDYYKEILPIDGSFAFSFYKISPLFMEIAYGFINTVAQSILAVVCLSIQIIMKFKNKYAAFICPFFFMYVVDYFCEIMAVSVFNKPFLCLSGIVQPSMCWALNEAPKFKDLGLVFGISIMIMLGCAVIGFFRNEDTVI